MLLNYFDFDGAEQKICRNCVDELQGRNNSETFNKLEYSTVYGMDKSEEDKEGV